MSPQLAPLNDTHTKQIERKAATRIMVIISAVYGLTLLLWAGTAPLSLMAFDAPGSTAMLAPWLIVGAVFSYPVLVIVGLVFGWWKRNYRWSLIAALLPLLPPLALAVIAVVPYLWTKFSAV